MLTLTLFLLLGSISSQTLTNLGNLEPQFTVSQGSGGFYLPSTNQIIFTESSAGYISALYLTPPAQNWTYYTNYVLNVNQSFDFILGNGVYGGEIRLDYVNPPTNYLALRPQGTCMLYNVGVLDTASYNALTITKLQTVGPYTQNNILWSDLSVGSVVAIFNWDAQPGSNFHYAKIQITAKNLWTGALNISTYAYTLAARKVVKGTGWSTPVDVTPSVDGLTYYVSEYATGSVWQVNAANPSKAGASLLLTVNRPEQLYLDQTSRKLYVVEYASSNGRLWCYDTVTAIATVLYTGLTYAVGVVGDGLSPSQTLYISEKTAGTISQFDLTALTKTVLITGLSSPQFLTRNSVSGHLYTAESSQISEFDFSVSPVAYTSLAYLSSASEAIYTSPGKYVITGANYVDSLVLSDAYFNANGPLLLGFGLVPITQITNGFATVIGPNYPIQVRDVPFGGGLTVIINHEGARNINAAYYIIYFNGVPQSAPFGDYKWVGNQFVYTLTQPISTYYFQVRNAADLWFNPFFGGYIDTTKVTTGLTNVKVIFYNSTWYSVATQTIDIMIDNVYPQAKIEQIYYYNNGSQIPVDACAIVQGTGTLFNFQITASDPDAHLLSIGLSAIWGNNQGGGVYGDSYVNHIAANKLWGGLSSTNVPLPPTTYWNASVPGDPSSTRCAHSFILTVWDRAFNGYNYIHSAGYHQSITLLLG